MEMATGLRLRKLVKACVEVSSLLFSFPHVPEPLLPFYYYSVLLNIKH